MKENPNTTHRLRQGKTAGLLGLICNLALSSSKIFIGLMSGAISVTADGLNNLSDAAASVITFLGFHFSSKPADRRHPYGHARFEYLSGLTVAALMLAIAFELTKSALTKIFHPELISVSPLLFTVLAASVAVKAFLALYYRRMGTKIDSDALIAAAEDSRNDTLTTLCVIAVAAAEYFIRIPLDGYASAFLSVFLFYSGLKTVKRTVSPLLGESGDPALRDRIRRQVLACEYVLGCHDLMIHDYGPHQCYATIHVETDGSMDAVKCHALMDRIERECLTELGVHLLIHHDPVHTDDPEIRRIKQLVETVLKIKNEALLLHDFRLSEKNGCPLISFDLVVPERFGETPEAFQKSLCDALLALDGTKYEAEITFDLQ